MSGCPAREQLALLLAEQLPGTEVEQVEAHVEECQRCQEVLDALSRGSRTNTTTARPSGQAKLSVEPRPAFLRQLRQAAPTSEAGIAEADTLPPTRVAKVEAWPVVAGYEIVAELGRGGMGVVYQAHQLALNRLVALKMILGGAHASATDLARFRAEAEAVARLQHPNIVQVYEVGEHLGLPYFSLEYIDGGSLDRRLASTPLPPRQAAQLVETLARAIHAAHQRGVVHRDLKPANILLSNVKGQMSNDESPTRRADGAGHWTFDIGLLTPKITDFGLAKRLDVEQRHTQSGAIVGTPSYMAPEQAGSKPGAIGAAVDIYALGALLYETLTGRPPFRAETPLDTLVQVIADEPVPPRRLQPRCPVDLETICLKCLAKDPGKRYPTALDLGGDLSRFLAGQPVRARPVPSWERAFKWMKRRPLAAALLLVSALAALGAVVGLVSWSYNSQLKDVNDQLQTALGTAEERKNEAEKARQGEEGLRQRVQAALVREESLGYVLNIERAYRFWRENEISRAIQALADCKPQLRNWEWRYLHQMCHPEMLILQGHTKEVRAVAFSPDGKRLASASEDNTLKVWDATTGGLLMNLTGAHGWLAGVAFSPDGKRLAAAGEGEVTVWDATTGQEVLILGCDASFHGIAFSPNGNRLAAAGGASGGPGVLAVWDASTGAEQVIQRAVGKELTGVAYSPDGKHLATAGSDGAVVVWNGATGQREQGWSASKYSVTDVAFSPDGAYVAASCFDREVQIWAVGPQARPLFPPGAESKQATSLAFCPDGKHLVTGGWDGAVRIWDATGAQLPLLLRVHSRRIRAMAFSSDGQRLASASEDNTVRVWDWAPKPEALVLEEKPAMGKPVAVSQDGQRLATFTAERQVKLWDIRRARAERTLPVEMRDEANLAFSPDDKRLAGIDAEGKVRVWDAASGKEEGSFQGSEVAQVTAIAFSPNGKYLAGGDSQGEVILWDATTGRLIGTAAGQHEHDVLCLAFSPDSTKLASASGDQSAKLWNLADGRELQSFAGHTHNVTSVAFHPDGKRIVTTSHDQTIKMWDVATGQQVYSIWDDSAGEGVAFSPDGSRLVSASHSVVKIWEEASGRELLSLKGSDSAAFSPDGTRLVTGSSDGGAKVWLAPPAIDIAEQKTVPNPPPRAERLEGPAGSLPPARLVLTGHHGPVSSITFDPRRSRLASAGWDKTVKVWGTTTKQVILNLTGHTHEVMSVAFSSDGQLLASASSDPAPRPSSSQRANLKEIWAELTTDPDKQPHYGEIIVWDANTGKEVRRLVGNAFEGANSVAFSSDGKRLAYGGIDGGVSICDTASYSQFTYIGRGAGEIWDVAFSPDGRQIAWASFDGNVWVCDSTSGKDVVVLKGHPRPVWSVAFSPDGKQLVSTSDDRTIKLWDMSSGKALLTLRGHTISPCRVVFSSDGKHIFSASGRRKQPGPGGEVLVWDAATGKQLAAVSSGTSDFAAMAWHPDGKQFAAAEMDGTVKVWDAAPLDLRRHKGGAAQEEREGRP